MLHRHTASNVQARGRDGGRRSAAGAHGKHGAAGPAAGGVCAAAAGGPHADRRRGARRVRCPARLCVLRCRCARGTAAHARYAPPALCPEKKPQANVAAIIASQDSSTDGQPSSAPCMFGYVPTLGTHVCCLSEGRGRERLARHEHVFQARRVCSAAGTGGGGARVALRRVTAHTGGAECAAELPGALDAHGWNRRCTCMRYGGTTGRYPDCVMGAALSRCKELCLWPLRAMMVSAVQSRAHYNAY